jgi:hypothetical protein
MNFLKHTAAKIYGWGQLGLGIVEQASSGHFPQNKQEWFALGYKVLLALALHKAASTDGTK